MTRPKLVKVSLDADEMYPVLHIGAYRPDTEVPVVLVMAIERAQARVDAAENALLDWLHERQPDHAVFRYFPRGSGS